MNQPPSSELERGLCISMQTAALVYILTAPGNILSKVKVKVTRSCLTLFNHMDYTVQARILEWVAFPICRGSSQPRDWAQVSRIAGGFFTSWARREAQEYWNCWPIRSPGDLPDPGMELGSLVLQMILYQLSYQGSPSEDIQMAINTWNHAQCHKSLRKCRSFSLRRLLLLLSIGAGWAGFGGCGMWAQQFQFMGSVIVAHGLSCPTECGIFLDHGLNPCPLYWQADF